MKNPLNGQYKFNPDTGRVYTEHPTLEKQAGLLDWAEDRAKLGRWQRLSEDKG